MQEAGRFTVLASHPSLPGHFPGNPVVPGVVLLSAVFAHILAAHPGQRVLAVPSAKFTHPVLPDQQVTVLCGPRGNERLPFSCTVAGREVLRGTIRIGPAGATVPQP